MKRGKYIGIISTYKARKNEGGSHKNGQNRWRCKRESNSLKKTNINIENKMHIKRIDYRLEEYVKLLDNNLLFLYAFFFVKRKRIKFLRESLSFL